MGNEKLRLRGSVRARKESEGGQAFVELFLTMTFILIPLLIGSVEFARAAYCYIEVSNAARAAVQYGAQNGATAQDTDGMLTAAQNDYSLNSTGALTMPTPQLACTCSDTGSSVSCSDPTVCTGAHIEKTLTVHTQAIFDPGFYEPFLARTFTVNGVAVQKVLQ
jgi:Flp pilus assembly protein TadG